MKYERRGKGKMKKWNWIWTDNNIGDEGARMISEALKINSTLTKLSLGGDDNWRNEVIVRHDRDR